MWKESPNDPSRHKNRIEYYLELIRIAERGKITFVFFADSYGANARYGGSTDATYRGGCQVAQLEPFMLISAMGAVPKSIGFVVSGNAVCLNPYITARSFATLDHIANERLGWKS